MPSKSLIEIINKHKIIATMGICKNAGKTTVLNYIVHELVANQTLGITSIGYDGEETDVITKLPKPKILVYKGMIVATTRSCLLKTEVKYELLHDPQMNTSIGQVFIARVLSEGFLEVSGPSIRSHLQVIGHKMIELGCDKVILDGAAGRISFGTIADVCILSIGAAISTSMKLVVKSSKHEIDILQLETSAEIIDLDLVKDVPYKKLSHHEHDYYVFRGSLVDGDLQELIKLEEKSDQEIRVVVNDPTTLFVSPKVLHKFRSKKGIIYVRHAINLEVITINPMSPYGEWFESDEFLAQMSQVTDLPIYDVKQ